MFDVILQPGLFVSIGILMEKRKDEKEDIEEHDEDMDNIRMKLDKEGTYYRKWTSLESGRLEEEHY